jgi:hypothetical protein
MSEAKKPHVELIDPLEKISPELGGTGYVGPKEPANALSLYANAAVAAKSLPELNMTVWKVLRSSVNWNKPAKVRRLLVGGRTIPCEIIGSVSDWWFVSVDAAKAEKILTPFA